MKTTPQLYRTCTLAEALTDGCDIVQQKYQGLWVRVEVAHGRADVYDRDGNSPTWFDVKNPDLACTLIGDLFGPPRHEISRIIIWDCWRVGQPESGEDARPGRLEWTSLEKFTYRDRYAFIRQQLDQIGLPLVPVKNYPIATAGNLWNIQGPDTCGLVFRRSKDPVEVVLKIARWYREMPRALE